MFHVEVGKGFLDLLLWKEMNVVTWFEHVADLAWVQDIDD